MKIASRQIKHDRFSGYIGLSCTFVVCICLVTGCKRQKTSDAGRPTLATTSQASPAPSSMPSADNEIARRELQKIGERIAAAVLAKDSTTIRSYGRDSDNETDLQNRSSGLYCYLFETGCMRSKGRSVYDILSTAREREIRASVTKSPVDGKLFGLLLFYDKSQVSEKMLRSKAFQCSDQSLKQVASWHFVLIDGKWNTSTLFDYETEGLCSEED